MEPLVPGLEALGCTVDIPTLPGHASSVREFRQTFFPDWLACIEERYIGLAQTHEAVIPVGFSMGGSIALILAAKHNPAGAVCLAPAFRLFRPLPWKKHFIWLLLAPVLQYVKPEMRLPPPNPASRKLAPFKGYDSSLWLPQVNSLGKGLKQMRECLPSVRCPLLLMYDARDRTCHPASALDIACAAASTDVRIRLLRQSDKITGHHMITTHAETRERVASDTAAFVKEIRENEPA